MYTGLFNQQKTINIYIGFKGKNKQIHLPYNIINNWKDDVTFLRTRIIPCQNVYSSENNA